MKSGFSRSVKLMGNMFALTIVDDDAASAESLFDAAIEEIRRIERLFTTYDPSSQANLINANAGIGPVKVDREVFDLIERSIAISKITQGAFDITYGGVDKSLWNFDVTMTTLPRKEVALKSVALINFQHIVLNESDCTVFLKKRGMRIGFGGIGKGYAAEMAKKVLVDRGVENGIINASGDLTAWGVQPGGKPWTIGIADPDHPVLPFSYMEISGKAVATSGPYEKFVMIDGKKYSHTIDPKTGLPVTGIKSVTVIAGNAELADALTTPVTVMGVEAGLCMINQLPGVHCIVVDDYNKIHTSGNIHLK